MKNSTSNYQGERGEDEGRGAEPERTSRVAPKRTRGRRRYEAHWGSGLSGHPGHAVLDEGEFFVGDNPDNLKAFVYVDIPGLFGEGIETKR
jgi:hypothetical protein